MEYCIALFISEREGFFREKAWINCPIDEYCACDGADFLFDVDTVMRKELIDVGERVKMTKPIRVERGLIGGEYIYASLSHQGILAIHANSNSKYIIQFTNLNTNEQVKVKVEFHSIIGFYDSMLLLLTWDRPLREATVEEVFNNPRIETFREIGGTKNVRSLTDVSLLQERRVLYYPTYDWKLFSFNVDTRENTEINVGMTVYTIASLTGIDCNIKAVFRDYDDKCTYTLNNDNSVTKVHKRKLDGLSAIFPSSSNPKNIKNAVFKHPNDLTKCGNNINTNGLTEPRSSYSVVRVYKDIFLAYDWNTDSWVLIRIVVSQTPSDSSDPSDSSEDSSSDPSFSSFSSTETTSSTTDSTESTSTSFSKFESSY